MIWISENDLTEDYQGSPSGKAAKINLRNHTSYVPVVTLNGIGGSGSATPQVVASMTIIYQSPDGMAPPS
jgi:hypothetical protein